MNSWVVTSALLSLIRSIHGNPMPTMHPRYVRLQEIQTSISNLTNWCDSNKNICNNSLVKEVIFDSCTKETFCKAAAALEEAETHAEPGLKKMLSRLFQILRITGTEGQKCTLEEKNEIGLPEFLKCLLKFSQYQYRKKILR